MDGKPMKNPTGCMAQSFNDPNSDPLSKLTGVVSVEMITC